MTEGITFAAPVSGRSRPTITTDNEFFWTAAAEHRLAVQRCRECGSLRHPSGPGCPHCLSLEWDPCTLSGRGSLYTYTVLHHPLAPGFDGPAVVAVIALDEGVRMVSNVIGADPDSLTIGEPLEVFFVDQQEGWTVPQFKRPGAGGTGSPDGTKR